MSVVIIIFLKVLLRPQDRIMVQQHPCLFVSGRFPYIIPIPHNPPTRKQNAGMLVAPCLARVIRSFVKRINKETLCRNGLA